MYTILSVPEGYQYPMVLIFLLLLFSIYNPMISIHHYHNPSDHLVIQKEHQYIPNLYY